MNLDLDFSECKNEQQFKMKCIKELLSKIHNYSFCIETEETIKGFPDVMCINVPCEDVRVPFFYEFKLSDKSGKIKFQPTQPAFYKSHKDLGIMVIALNKKTGKAHSFPVEDLFHKESKYYMNEKAEVRL